MKTRRTRPEYRLGLRYLAEHGELTLADLTNLLGLHKDNVRDYVAVWFEDKRIFIKRWEPHPKTGPQFVLALRTANQVCAKKPVPKTSVERAAKYRQANRAVIRAREVKRPRMFVQLIAKPNENSKA